ncbi:MAG: DEAD/DEAH box helicase [Candidatus Bathyarchaeia archaeon]
MTQTPNPFSMLNKPVRKIVKERGFISPTDPQVEAVPIILEGKNVLLIAPTGTGKTEAAFLPVFSKLIELSRRHRGIKVLYITPLRALNRDILERLKWWCEKLDVKVAVRHGDTSSRERLAQSRSPPDMLITTPETLQAILPGRNMRQHLKQTRWVIIDEIHEFAEDKRGSQLSLALERLRLITERDFQVIGLSATIGSPEKVAKFLVGTERPFEIVQVHVARFMNFEIINPIPNEEDYALASRLYTHPEVAARLQVIRRLIEGHKAVLLFTNTRSIAEVLASRFKVWDVDFPVSIHHGSLAKPARILAERGIKDGELKGLVCTSSLELGIDVGHIDLCIQYMSPRQVARLVQRVGRSGHRVGRVAKGVIITMDSDDTLEAIVIARRAYLEELESVAVPEAPYDALVHQLVGLLMFSRSWRFDQLLSIINRAYPYRDFQEEDLINVLTYMHDRYPRLAWVSFEDKIVLKPGSTKELYKYYYETLSMIPNRKSYLVVDETKDMPIGILDEVFVAEYGDPGVKFIVQGSVWRITSVYGDKIYVKPVLDPTGAIPSWVGEEIPVPFNIAREVGNLRAFVEANLVQNRSVQTIASQLSKKYPANEDTIVRAVSEIVEHFEKGYNAPTDKRVTLEDWGGSVVLNVCFGSLVNRTLALLIGHTLSEKIGYTIGIQESAYRVIIQGQDLIHSDDVYHILNELSRMDLESVAVKAAVKGRLFKRRIIHIARKFGAVSKSADLSNVSLNQLLKSFQGTAIFDEAVKVALKKDMDLENVATVFEEIKTGELDLVILDTGGDATPLTTLGLEKMKKRVSLISPEKMKYISIESARARLLNEAKTFVCTSCWGFLQMSSIKDVPASFACPRCDSHQIGILDESEETVARLCEKIGLKMTANEEKLVKEALETGGLMAEHGRLAALVLAGKNLSHSSVKEILSKEQQISNQLFELVVEAERKALARRFW